MYFPVPFLFILVSLCNLSLEVLCASQIGLEWNRGLGYWIYSPLVVALSGVLLVSLILPGCAERLDQFGGLYL